MIFLGSLTRQIPTAFHAHGLDSCLAATLAYRRGSGKPAGTTRSYFDWHGRHESPSLLRGRLIQPLTVCHVVQNLWECQSALQCCNSATLGWRFGWLQARTLLGAGAPPANLKRIESALSQNGPLLRFSVSRTSTPRCPCIRCEASMAAMSFCKVSWSTSLKYRSFL